MREIIEIDAIDKNIISMLQTDCTRSIQDIALEVGLTNNPAWRRVKRLEELGVITKRVAIIDANRLGLNNTAFVSIRISAHQSEWLEPFNDCVQSIPEILECHRMAGEVDYLLKIAIRDLSHYDQVYQSIVQQVPNLADVSATFSMETIKHKINVDVSSL